MRQMALSDVALLPAADGAGELGGRGEELPQAVPGERRALAAQRSERRRDECGLFKGDDRRLVAEAAEPAHRRARVARRLLIEDEQAEGERVGP